MADTDDKKTEDAYDLGDEYVPEYEEAGSETEVELEPDFDLDLGGTEPEPEMAAGGMSPMLKRMLMVGGAIVGTIIITWILIVSDRSKVVAEEQGVPEQEQTAPTTKVAQAPEPTPKKAQVAMPAILQGSTETAVKTEAAPAPTAMTQEQQKQLTDLASQVRSNKLTLDNVEVKLETLQESVKKGLSDMQATLQEKLAPPKPKVIPKPKKKVVAKRPAKPREIFGLKAAVPGRAWIYSSQGRAITVTLGDRISGYGHVKSINPGTGKVVTSSGVVITYGPGDY